MTNAVNNFECLISYFKNYFPLGKKEVIAIAEVVTERRLKRKQAILRQGDICRHFSFIVSGCFKMYVIDKTGKEHNLQFAAEDKWITDLASFYSETSSEVYIEAIEPSIILQIRHDDLLDLYNKYHKFDRNFRIINEQNYIELQTRVLQSISLTSEDRYLSFLKQYPNLSNRLSAVQIASYMGITPEFLSKIRKGISHKALPLN